MTLVGVALIVLGVVALAYQGITYTAREKVIDLGPLKASVDKEKSIPLLRSSAWWRLLAAASRSASPAVQQFVVLDHRRVSVAHHDVDALVVVARKPESAPRYRILNALR